MPRLAGAVVALAALLPAAAAWSGSAGPNGERRAPVEVGNDACAGCHRAIYDSYARTAMARTSGPALPNLIEGSYDHASSAVSYRVERQGDEALFSYARSSRELLHGTHPLKYSLGSNTRGRTFLFEVDDFLYQLPINYYAAKRVWDMAPGFARTREMTLSRPVDGTCLFCHASRVETPAPGTLNRFAGEAFLQPGVSCERCHGPGGDHVKGAGPMINPADLTGERRDSICVQCHLEGEGRIAIAGHNQNEYRPGEALSTYLAIFVRDDAASGRLGAVSHVEALERSTCRQSSGGALSCITCHDPHAQLREADRAGHYRARCVSCHAGLETTHFPERQDCIACHMPRAASADIGHTMVTDHRIVRTPRQATTAAGPAGQLIEFGRPVPRPRELALAYGELALRGNAFAAGEALRRLEQLLPSHPDDADLLTRLGYLHQIRGDMARAERLYDRAFREDRHRAVAAANLGAFYARRGELTRALELWRDVFTTNPHLSDAGLNLANGLCAVGDADGAEQVLRRVLRHNPDFAGGRTLLAAVSGGQCARR